MEPLYFDQPANQKFGVYHPPRNSGGIEKAVLICSPLMQENIRAYRACQELATQLSYVGYHVLRFDYSGTGDSAGDITDQDLLAWREDINFASAELKEISGLDFISIIGIRMGATLAASCEIKQVDRLILWDPVVDGDDYLNNLKNIHRQILISREHFPFDRTDKTENGMRELVGFAMNDLLFSQIGSLKLSLSSTLTDTKTGIISSRQKRKGSLDDFVSLHDNVALYNINYSAEWNNILQIEKRLLSYEYIKKTIELLS